MSELETTMKAVGLDFNPTGDTNVIHIKKLFVDTILLLQKLKREKIEGKENKLLSWYGNVFYTAAFNALIAAEMAVVKFITWNDNEMQ